MKALAIKGAIGAVGITGLSAGSYYGYQALNKETKPEKVTIANRLENEKYTLLNASSSNLQTVLGNYKSGKLKFLNFTGQDVTGEKADVALLRHCEVALKNENTESEDYSKAKQWCVEPVSVSELLKKRNINPLSFATSDTEKDKAKWEDKIKKYRSSSSSRIDGLTFSSQGTTLPTPQEIVNAKTKCNEIKDKKNHEDKFDETLKAFELWCSDN